MYIRIRREIPASELIFNCTKNTQIVDVIRYIALKWGYPKHKQLLFYKGIQLSCFFRIIEYKIKHNEVITFVEKSNQSIRICPRLRDTRSKFYKLGDLVEVRCNYFCAWWPGQIIAIKKHRHTIRLRGMRIKTYERKLTFIVRFANATDGDRIYITNFDCMRFPKNPVPYEELKRNDYIIVKKPHIGIFDDMGVEMRVRGFHPRHKIILADIIYGKRCCEDNRPQILLYKELSPNIQKLDRALRVRRTPRDKCIVCKDFYSNPRGCDCFICPDLIPRVYPEGYNALDTNNLLRREFNIPTPHISSALKKRKGYQEDAFIKSWGAGASCLGRSHSCTIVPKTHRGPIPGVDVGTRWKFRTQVSEAGVHRPLVAGVHGGEKEGAYSLIISGGYEEDFDLGHEFLYTGSGGRNFGNQRVVAQTSDQELVRTNRALALSCWADISPDGATSENWKNGFPIRVCRSYKQAEHSVFAPREGIRYDGIYKVVRYYSEKGPSGYLEWKFLLRRDDPNPAPWEEEGEEHDIIYPEGYVAAIEQKEVKQKKRKPKEIDPSIERRVTRQQTRLAEEDEVEFHVLGPMIKGKGKSTKKSYQLDQDVQKLIELDEKNKNLWEQSAEIIKLGKIHYIARIKEDFACILCLDTVFEPITTDCKHNMCLKCLQRSFEANIFECPYCKTHLGEDYNMQVNENLAAILERLMPGYGQYR